jgi:sensor c-di-GMP phosphodiesterase-like protein
MHDPRYRQRAQQREPDEKGRMRKRIATTIALALCMLAVVVPIAAALYLAHQQSMQQASVQALALAGELLHRGDTAGEQAIAAYERLRRSDTTGPCSDEKRARLREVVMDYSYLQAIGFVSGNRVACSAIGPRGDGIDLGPPSYIGTMGARVRASVAIGSERFVVLEKGGFAAAVHPELLLDVSTGIPNLSLGVYGRSAKVQWAHRGTSALTWMPTLRPGEQKVFFDGKNLVATRASKRLDLGAYVAIPLADLNSRLRSFLIILLPIGLVLGTAMAWAIVFLARQRASLPSVLRLALKRREFVLHYQPIVELDTGRIAGAEALLRWPANSEVGMRPGLFVQAAEECGLIRRFTEYVLAQVAIDGPQFFRLHPGAYISVNLSSADFCSNDVVDWLRRLVATPGIAPYNIVVEMTEHSFVDPANAEQIISQIRALGVRVAIDDFGTGFSSLSHLHHLHADYLKIDKVFVDAIGTGSVTSEVVLHIIDMARSLNLILISEGVETQDQADFLRERGVVYAQGWLFSKAMPLAELLSRHEAG